MKKVKKVQKIHKTIAYLQKLRYKLPAFNSVAQCRSVKRIFFKQYRQF